jgi:hypothetical protein
MIPNQVFEANEWPFPEPCFLGCRKKIINIGRINNVTKTNILPVKLVGVIDCGIMARKSNACGDKVRKVPIGSRMKEMVRSR